MTFIQTSVNEVSLGMIITRINPKFYVNLQKRNVAVRLGPHTLLGTIGTVCPWPTKKSWPTRP